MEEENEEFTLRGTKLILPPILKKRDFVVFAMFDDYRFIYNVPAPALTLLTPRLRIAGRYITETMKTPPLLPRPYRAWFLVTLAPAIGYRTFSYN